MYRNSALRITHADKYFYNLETSESIWIKNSNLARYRIKEKTEFSSYIYKTEMLRLIRPIVNILWSGAICSNHQRVHNISYTSWYISSVINRIMIEICIKYFEEYEHLCGTYFVSFINNFQTNISRCIYCTKCRLLRLNG